jgi:hypothetical protein
MSLQKNVVLLLALSAFTALPANAQNNNTGQIVIQGAVPGTWELTVYDINSGYDFDLSDVSPDLTARVGTIHIYTNDGSDAAGHLFIESDNTGRMINRSSIPGIAAEHQSYMFSILDNAISGNTLSPAATSTLTIGDFATTGGFNLVVPATIDFDGGAGSSTADEITYDIEVTIPGINRPQASGVYTDTITFTIMDEN